MAKALRIVRETVRIERRTVKTPILSCGHKYRPIENSKPVRKRYNCFSCVKNQKRKDRPRGEEFLERGD